ncbi:hypothetical protein [Thermofilum pendens]|uniref:Uncharacterized protein n=1 Tax=Thermofilum pendens (strain DSM 2475 / Hrk 5) TaxID=368408 RepID=A1S199_THEPD|nr:hypothetical protein [Thermofilum pendens]ABL79229.1 hypothetical protein Tpen_1834 [Thermofilum pendens Hrk 5]
MKKVLWALDIPAFREAVRLLEESLKDQVQVVGVGPLYSADEVLKLIRELEADEVVTAIEDPCEMNKLLSSGVQPLVMITEDVAECGSREECLEYESKGYLLLEKEDGVKVVALKEFLRVVDIMFQLVEPSEVHVHDEEE